MSARKTSGVHISTHVYMDIASMFVCSTKMSHWQLRNSKLAELARRVTGLFLTSSKLLLHDRLYHLQIFVYLTTTVKVMSSATCITNSATIYAKKGVAPMPTAKRVTTLAAASANQAILATPDMAAFRKSAGKVWPKTLARRTCSEVVTLSFAEKRMQVAFAQSNSMIFCVTDQKFIPWLANQLSFTCALTIQIARWILSVFWLSLTDIAVIPVKMLNALRTRSAFHALVNQVERKPFVSRLISQSWCFLPVPVSLINYHAK